MQLTCTYDPSDNKLRLTASTKLPPDLYTRVKAAGFAWAPKLEQFIAPAWSPAREDLALELCGQIDDEDTTLADRAEVRAERFADYHDKREHDATQAHAAVERIADGIPLGQPILVGHHSERRARKDAQRIEDGMRKAVNLWETAQYWQDRARGALRHATYKERPAVRARRIKGLEADLRKQERCLADNEKFLRLWTRDGHNHDLVKQLANYDHLSQCFPLVDYPREPPASQYEGAMGLSSALDGGVITAMQAQALAMPAHGRIISHTHRWIAHLTHRLAYERAMLAEAGGIVADKTTPEKGGACKCWASPSGGWSYIHKVNKVSVTVLDVWNQSDSKPFTRTMPFDKLTTLLSKSEVDSARDAGRLKETKHGTGFFLLESREAFDVKESTAEKAEKAQYASFPTSEAVPMLTRETVSALKDTLTAGIQVVTVPHLFPTPPDLAARMVALADIQPGDHVLEPSAGNGQLLGALTHGSARLGRVVAVEINHWAAEFLRCQRDAGAYQDATVFTQDFLTCTTEDLGMFDVVCMNPPFSPPGTDTQHVTHALAFLRPGGHLVAVLSAMAGQRHTKADRAFLALLEAQDSYEFEALPPGTFHDSGTEVQTQLLILTKAQETPQPQETHSMRTQQLSSDAMGLSSGTLATLTGLRTYAELDTIRTAFVTFCAAYPHPRATWHEAWQAFWNDYTHTLTPTLATVAEALTVAAAQTQAQITRARLEAETRTKCQAQKAQAEPVGLFAQTQGTLF